MLKIPLDNNERIKKIRENRLIREMLIERNPEKSCSSYRGIKRRSDSRETIKTEAAKKVISTVCVFSKPNNKKERKKTEKRGKKLRERRDAIGLYGNSLKLSRTGSGREPKRILGIVFLVTRTTTQVIAIVEISAEEIIAIRINRFRVAMVIFHNSIKNVLGESQVALR